MILEITLVELKAVCPSSDILELEVASGMDKALHLCFPICPSISLSCFPSVAQVLDALELVFDLLCFAEVDLVSQAKNVLAVAPSYLGD